MRDCRLRQGVGWELHFPIFKKGGMHFTHPRKAQDDVPLNNGRGGTPY